MNSFANIPEYPAGYAGRIDGESRGTLTLDGLILPRANILTQRVAAITYCRC